jgi:short-subunit dehydrogenase
LDVQVADKQAVEEIKKQGIESIDVVIANAAVNLGCGVGFKDIDVELQEETFRINVSHLSLEVSPRTGVEKLMTRSEALCFCSKLLLVC